MESAQKYLCHACGQICMIERVNRMNDAPVMHCPACGSPSLATTRTSFEAYTADCFRMYGIALTNLLSQDWARNRAGERTFWPAFVDYAAWRVALTDDTGCPCCSTGG